MQLAQEKDAFFSILETQSQQNCLGKSREEQPFAEHQLKNHFWPLFNQTNHGGCGHQYTLWHVVAAAGLLSKRMIVPSPAVENKQNSNIPSDSRSP